MIYNIYFGESKIGVAVTEEKAIDVANLHRRGYLHKQSMNIPGTPFMKALKWHKTESGMVAINGRYKILSSI